MIVLNRVLAKVVLALCALALPLSMVLPASAQEVNASVVRGVVKDTSGKPLGGIAIALDGAGSHLTTTTDATGAFSFSVSKPGLYKLSVSAKDFVTVKKDFAILGDVSIDVEMAPVAFKELAHVIARSGDVAINPSPASVTSISADVFRDRGEILLRHVIEEIPGVTVFRNPTANFSTSTSPISITNPQIRGAFSYETANLIDGHPVYTFMPQGGFGGYNLAAIDPYQLQRVDVVKGPGVDAPTINSAVGGSINYVTSVPASTRHSYLQFGTDGFGGSILSSTFSGPVFGRWSASASYTAINSPGPNSGQGRLFTFAPLLNYGSATQLLNGQKVSNNCASPNTSSACTTTNLIIPGTTFVSSFIALNTTQLVFCCTVSDINYQNHAENLKLNYHIGKSTDLSFAYMGSQSLGNSINNQFNESITFNPTGTSYSGPLAPGTISMIPGFNPIQYGEEIYQNVFLTKLDSDVGKGHLTAGYLWLASQNVFGTGSVVPDSTQVVAYGNAFLGTSTTPTVFSGTPVTLSFNNTFLIQNGRTGLQGGNFKYTLPVGSTTLSLAGDHTTFTPTYYTYLSLSGVITPFPANVGAAQTFSALALHASGPLSNTLTGTVGLYLNSYDNKVSSDGDKTFQHNVTGYTAPRFGLVFRPSPDLAFRASAGGAIAPPPITKLDVASTVPAGSPPANPVLYTQTVNSNGLKPETSWAYDVGADFRLGDPNTLVSLDVYRTNLRNQYLTSTSLNGTFNNLPLYISTTSNLGNSRYEGVEWTLKRSPSVGWTYTLDGALMRAYLVSVPAGFYDSNLGPNTKNSLVVPNVNFQGTFLTGAGVGDAPIPYSQGYAEVGYRFPHRSNATLRATYYGPNNTYYRPAFVILGATAQLGLGEHAALQLSADNLSNQYSSPYLDAISNKAVPLENGNVGVPFGDNYGPRTVKLSMSYRL